METKKDTYHISFFKPSNERTRANRNMILWLVSIWAIAVFGFHFLLKIIEKPTPEKALTEYMTVKDNIFNGTADTSDYIVYAKSNLQVLCKVFIPKDTREQLQKTMNWAIYKIADPQTGFELQQRTRAFETIHENTTDITDKDYKKAKIILQEYSAPLLNIDKNDRRAAVLPLELHADYAKELSKAELIQSEEIMEKYMTHYESALTRARFLGFPFHYFYTAVFLLILFVLICFIYAKRTDTSNKRHNFQD